MYAPVVHEAIDPTPLIGREAELAALRDCLDRARRGRGGLFVVEALSVIIQVASFKLTGKRVFRMAPIHHHFEALGWTEAQIVIRFWIVAVLLALIGLSSLKLR